MNGILVYETDAIIITDYNSMAKLVEWATGPQAEGLKGKKILVVESSWSLIVDRKQSQRSTLVAFLSLIGMARKIGLDFIFIVQDAKRLDLRLQRQIETVRDLLLLGRDKWKK